MSGPQFLGQSYIIDSFMVVVFRAAFGTVGTGSWAAFTLGIAKKILETFAGRGVLGKIRFSWLIICFIQKNVHGGRSPSRGGRGSVDAAFPLIPGDGPAERIIFVLCWQAIALIVAPVLNSLAVPGPGPRRFKASRP